VAERAEAGGAEQPERDRRATAATTVPAAAPRASPATFATSTPSASQEAGLPAITSLRRVASLDAAGVRRRPTARAARYSGRRSRSLADRASSRSRRSPGRSSTARIACRVRYAWRRSSSSGWTESATVSTDRNTPPAPATRERCWHGAYTSILVSFLIQSTPAPISTAAAPSISSPVEVV
jgi:hypothetical protein